MVGMVGARERIILRLIQFSEVNMINLVSGKTYLVTGGPGFLGEALIKRLPSDIKIRVLSRNEGKLILLKEKYPEIEILTGDVSDYSVCRLAMRGVTGVFHLSAFKHIGLAEKQSKECVKSNVIGSLNILEASNLEPELRFVLAISTDKAAKISGVYGATKFLMEKLFEEYEQLNPSVEYRVIRYGNVLYSTGSVLCKWKALLEQGMTSRHLQPKNDTR